MKLLTFLFLLLLIPVSAWAQNTGTSFPTPAGDTAQGTMLLVPCGAIVNGQPTACPPGPLNGLPVICNNCSPSAPTGATSNAVSGTIATTNTFQQLIPSNVNRKACLFQNTSADIEYFSYATTPTLANSFQVGPGGTFGCSSGGITITDSISITGVAGDAFTGGWQ
jgi:hypothetical protein